MTTPAPTPEQAKAYEVFQLVRAEGLIISGEAVPEQIMGNILEAIILGAE